MYEDYINQENIANKFVNESYTANTKKEMMKIHERLILKGYYVSLITDNYRYYEHPLNSNVASIRTKY